MTGTELTAEHWRVSGRYFESCNCEAICPCRRVGGRAGGRSTYGICFGVLGWLIEDGHARGIDLGGLSAALVLRYDDDEPGSPWRFVLHVDERGSVRQQETLADILLGRLGSKLVLALPWVRKPSELIAVHPSAIAFEHGREGHQLRVGTAVTLRASRPVVTNERVSCVIPGHHRAGTELYADRLSVNDGPFQWELAGNCAFVSEFSYGSEDDPSLTE